MAGKPFSERSLLEKFLVFVIGAAAFAAANYGVRAYRSAENHKAYRQAFIESSVKACTTTQMNAKENAGMSPAVIASYCTCYSEGSVDALSDDQKSRVHPGVPIPQDVMATLTDVGNKCAAGLKTTP